jgi:hypothetical protein
MTYLLPGERLDGTAAERAHLRRLLVSFRTDPPPMRLPHVSGCPLPETARDGPAVTTAGRTCRTSSESGAARPSRCGEIDSARANRRSRVMSVILWALPCRRRIKFSICAAQRLE